MPRIERTLENIDGAEISVTANRRTAGRSRAWDWSAEIDGDSELAHLRTATAELQHRVGELEAELAAGRRRMEELQDGLESLALCGPFERRRMVALLRDRGLVS